MDSLSDKTNLLQYLRSRTQVDVDTLDLDVIKRLGPFVDCTSNQAETYTELLKPQHTSILKKASAMGKQFSRDFPGGHVFHDVSEDELAVEIAMVMVGLLVMPHIKGKLHLMANPVHASSRDKIVQNGQRIVHLIRKLDPSFDFSQFVLKVSCTWEGMQACIKLNELGIQTLATLVFTMPQAVLAGEVGVKSISPFCHELRAHFDESHLDPEPGIGLCVRAQSYYKEHAVVTRVKACGMMTLEEILQLAGVAAMTIPAGQLDELAANERSIMELEKLSLFQTKAKYEERVTYVYEEEKYRTAVSAYGRGFGEAKLMDGIQLFCEYQSKAEAMMRDLDLTSIG